MYRTDERVVKMGVSLRVWNFFGPGLPRRISREKTNNRWACQFSPQTRMISTPGPDFLFRALKMHIHSYESILFENFPKLTKNLEMMYYRDHELVYASMAP